MDTVALTFLLTFALAGFVSLVALIYGSYLADKVEVQYHAGYCRTVQLSALSARLQFATRNIQDEPNAYSVRTVYSVPVWTPRNGLRG